MSAFVNYPLTASDDDEFFDAPVGAMIVADGSVLFTCVGPDFQWQAADGTPIQAGMVWGGFFQDGNPFGEFDIQPGLVLRVPLEWARAYGLAASREAAEAEAEARVAAWMAEGTA